MSTEPNELWRTLGGIEKSLEAVLSTLAEDRVAAASYRTDVRKELGAVKDSVGTLAADLRICKSDIAEIKPKVESQEKRMLMSKGMANLAVGLGKFSSIIWGGLGATIAVLLDRWLHSVTPGR